MYKDWKICLIVIIAICIIVFFHDMSWGEDDYIPLMKYGVVVNQAMSRMRVTISIDGKVYYQDIIKPQSKSYPFILPADTKIIFHFKCMVCAKEKKGVCRFLVRTGY